MQRPVTFKFTREFRKATPRKHISTSDGDTPVIEQPIRMISVDLPERAAYAGGPAISQPKLARCRERLRSHFFDFLPRSLREYLAAKLTPDAAARHIAAANKSRTYFATLVEARLRIDDDERRSVAVIPSGEVVDRYGRLLAYLAPWFEGGAADPLPPRGAPSRRTFNLELIESGWAAFFPIYPSLPRNGEMNAAIEAAEDAWSRRRGQWEYGDDLLLAYEYRACIKLAQPLAVARRGRERRMFYTREALLAAGNELSGWDLERHLPQQMASTAFQRSCVDLRSMREVGPYEFGDVPPPYRLWIWDDQLAEARKALELPEIDPPLE